MAEPSRLPVTILFIEDDVNLRTVLCNLLRTWAGPSMRCIEANTLAEGLAALPYGGIDVIILDWRIVEHPSAETIAQLQEAMPEHQPCIPIEIISGNITEEEGLAALEAGADDFHQKGADLPLAFVRMVKRAWARHQAYLHALRPQGHD